MRRLPEWKDPLPGWFAFCKQLIPMSIREFLILACGCSRKCTFRMFTLACRSGPCPEASKMASSLCVPPQKQAAKIFLSCFQLILFLDRPYQAATAFRSERQSLISLFVSRKLHRYLRRLPPRMREHRRRMPGRRPDCPPGKRSLLLGHAFPKLKYFSCVWVRWFRYQHNYLVLGPLPDSGCPESL
jgi:hypothetical protein